MTIRQLCLCLGLTLAFACGDDDPSDGSADASTTSDAAVSGEATTYYVVRHTERDPGLDPPINAEGEVRAVALADRLEDAGIDEIVTTEFIRGQQSGQPLADRLGQTITVAPFTMDASWTDFATAVGGWQRDREIAGQTTLMIGHSGGYNTTLLNRLGADLSTATGERYEELVILVREPDGTVSVTVETYGGEISLDP